MIIIRGRDEDAASQRKQETFTGETWLDPVLPARDGVAMNVVTFTPGAHTFWHSHEHGQILQVTAGRGWVCSETGEPQLIRAGDVIWTPPGERHWHGATSKTYLVHTAISLGTTNWAEEVPADQYPV